MAANQFFLSAAVTQQPVARSNQYGGTIGGPVYVPKVFNGKDKLFFFLAYQGFKDSSPGVTTTAVPTAAERNGDFAALLSAADSNCPTPTALCCQMAGSRGPFSRVT
jgi:hypothetical protein